MPPDKMKIRVVKRTEREATAAEAAARPRGPASHSVAPTQTTREMQTVVSGWVLEHRRRADEFRSTYSSLLKRSGFNLERSSSRT